ncbi:cytochrome c oxidase subunit II [Halobacillus sp. ACCC02827]|uniref:cytochrome c oxidase subunit II n=1 Tax=Bacillaceae TaxID=186817 RepID=UPI0002A4F5C3|nr:MULTISPECIES: cytochrome c oxidase subunit II [Bacillaceae]ELK45012.1 cytochrome c oxidase subunit II [Halobacillus sp. BAB-2008]QHT46525.1 cytochrome c oxidase subunit II [Bacillus sp. SB49]WJE17339.1 cytochrome c oxidase subunit II [Halobacillus sp. ACCC02827]
MRGWTNKFRSFLLLGFLTAFLSGCGEENLSALKPKGYGAELLLDLMLISIAIMIFVFVIVMAIYAFVLIRFREKKGQEHVIPKQTEGNKALEVIWTVIPIILLLVLAIPTVQATFDLADQSTQGDEGVVTIEVTGNQYWWHFNYPDQEIAVSQELYIPTGERVYLNMKSSDVIHSFWLPSIAGKMDTNPGENMNTMYLEANEEGVYWGHCAELCGPSHSLMDFRVVAVSPDEYDQWVEDMQNIDPEAAPETTSAQDGQKLFNDNCMSCHAIGGASAGVGPNLANFGNREKIAGILEPSKENLVDWIVQPDEVKPGNQMPSELVTEDEAADIADYLLQLQHSDVGSDVPTQSEDE